MPDPLIKAPFLQQPTPPLQTLMLNQLEGWEPVQEFTDSANVHWTLAKAATDSTRDIPDPKTVQFVGAWNHEFPAKLSQKVYVYAVEAIRPPRVATEQPSMLFYQWFSTVKMDFNPQMITDREWLKANVYAAPLVDSRMSKLLAICKVQAQPPQGQQAAPAEEDKPIRVEEIVNASSGNMPRDKKQGREGR
jgi:hypothetical protein